MADDIIDDEDDFFDEPLYNPTAEVKHYSTENIVTTVHHLEDVKQKGIFEESNDEPILSSPAPIVTSAPLETPVPQKDEESSTEGSGILEVFCVSGGALLLIAGGLVIRKAENKRSAKNAIKYHGSDL